MPGIPMASPDRAAAPFSRWISFVLVCAGVSTAGAQSTGRINVAPNVMVSGDRPKQEHGEAVICASLGDPNLLIAAAASASNGKPIYAYGETSGEIAYYSRDGGKSWHYALDTFSAGAISPDASCAYSPDGSAHFMSMLAARYTPQQIDLDLRLIDYLDVDAAGAFHPAWVDARTGVRHIWTTRVTGGWSGHRGTQDHDPAHHGRHALAGPSKLHRRATSSMRPTRPSASTRACTIPERIGCAVP